MTNGSTTTVMFSFEKETPGSVRYQESDADGNAIKIADGATVGTLYVRKTALNGSVPKMLEVTIKAAK